MKVGDVVYFIPWEFGECETAAEEEVFFDQMGWCVISAIYKKVAFIKTNVKDPAKKVDIRSLYPPDELAEMIDQEVYDNFWKNFHKAIKS